MYIFQNHGDTKKVGATLKCFLVLFMTNINCPKNLLVGLLKTVVALTL